MKLAYIISAYKYPEQLVRLVRRIHAPGACIVIHVDRNTAATVYDAMTRGVADLDGVHFLPRHRCFWGDFGHVWASLKGIHYLLRTNRPFDYVALLTGQDYPTHARHIREGVLRECTGDEFIEGKPLPYATWPEGGLTRVEKWHFNLLGRRFSFPENRPFRNPLLGMLWRFLVRCAPDKRKMPLGHRPHGGGSYWCLSRDCVEYIDRFVDEHPGYVRFFRTVHVPDELFFQTLVMNSPYRERVRQEGIHLVNWNTHSPHPEILTSDDFDRIAATRHLFARKFDATIDSAVLDRIDGLIEREEQEHSRISSG